MRFAQEYDWLDVRVISLHIKSCVKNSMVDSGVSDSGDAAEYTPGALHWFLAISGRIPPHQTAQNSRRNRNGLVRSRPSYVSRRLG